MKKIAFLSFVAALGGILFGYDTAVISGTIAAVGEQFRLDAMAKGWYVGCALCAGFTDLVVYRIVGGVGIGIVSIVSPVYISEMNAANLRRRRKSVTESGEAESFPLVKRRLRGPFLQSCQNAASFDGD